MRRIAFLAAAGSLALAACSPAASSQGAVISAAATPFVPSPAVPTTAPAAPTRTNPPATPAAEPVLSHVTGTLQGGWHGPSPTVGCSRTMARAHDFMSCYSVLSDPRVSGTFAIEAVVGTPLAGYGVVEIWPETAGGKWQGRWFAAADWPRTAPGVGGEDSYGPLPAELTMDWAWLEGTGANGGLTFVLTIRNGVIDGWIYRGTMSNISPG